MRNTAGTLVLWMALVAMPAGLQAQAVVDQSTPTTAATMAVLSQQIDHAEALRSIKRLQWAYGHYSELGLWYDFADLFADSGIGHYTQGDLNRDQIRALFFDQVGQGRLGLATNRIYPHISFSPVVDVAADGTHGKGRYRILAMLGGYGGNAIWFHGVYENAYVKEQGIWKINEVSNTGQISGTFRTGLSVSTKAPLDTPTFPFHFSPQQVGQVMSVAAIDKADNPPQPAVASLVALQVRLDQLDDEAAIVRLQHQYGYYLDQHNWDGLTALFAEHGSFESGQQGVYIGKTSIRKMLNQFGSGAPAQGEVDDHLLFQTYVSLAPDGRSAKARVDQLGMQGRQGISGEWTQGIYENTFIKENSAWRIQTLHYYPRLITDYAKGWGADAQPAPGPSVTDPPDASPTEKYDIYPAFYIPAFHFLHPVTGRAPQYPAGDPAIGKAIGYATTGQSPKATPGRSGKTETLAQLSSAAQRALAVDAVENLVNAYAYYLDECQTQDAATLFAANGINEIPGIGVYQGNDRIAHALQLAYCPHARQEGELTLHHLLQPVITLDSAGESATVLAKLWQVHATGKDDDYYLMGQLEVKAIKQGELWQLVSLSPHYTWAASVQQGWAHATTNEALGYAAPMQMLTQFPPDQPGHSARLAPYP